MGFVTKEKFLSKDFFVAYAWLLGGCFVFALLIFKHKDE